MGIVAFAGSRSLSFKYEPLVSTIVASVIQSGRTVSVGCCVGLDEIVLSNLESGLCFSAFGSCGSGSCSLSASAAVSEFAGRGGSVNYWAGGHGDLKSRLSGRTNAVINSADVSAVVFFSSPHSVGSALACRLSVARGLPVFAFACGFSGSALPLLGSGKWVAVGGSGVWSSSWRWISSQTSLF